MTIIWKGVSFLSILQQTTQAMTKDETTIKINAQTLFHCRLTVAVEAGHAGFKFYMTTTLMEEVRFCNFTFFFFCFLKNVY